MPASERKAQSTLTVRSAPYSVSSLLRRSIDSLKYVIGMPKSASPEVDEVSLARIRILEAEGRAKDAEIAHFHSETTRLQLELARRDVKPSPTELQLQQQQNTCSSSLGFYSAPFKHVVRAALQPAT